MQSLLQYCGFLDGRSDLRLAFPAAYDPILVTLSILIASLAAYAALGLAGRIHAADTRAAKRLWLAAGAVTMGIDHPNYKYEVPLSEAQRKSLAADLA